jgi:hypothetical protein
MDPWLADRYAGVERRDAVPAARPTPPAETRLSRRRADEVLREVGSGLRRRVWRRRLFVAFVLLGVVGVAGWAFTHWWV